MQHGPQNPNDPVAPRDHFLTTHWSVVSAAGKDDIGAALQALEVLCQGYWYPLYAYVRRRGYTAQDAQDLTQGFFAKLLTGDGFAGLDRKKGRFRAFLLASLKHYLANEWDRRNAGKRGGAAEIIALDADAAESQYRIEMVDSVTPEQLFERRWALALIEQVLHMLRSEYSEFGNAALFDLLKSTLPGGGHVPKYVDVASQAGMSEGAVKVAVHRLRKRFRRLLREQIATTLARPEDLDDEVRHLLQSLSG